MAFDQSQITGVTWKRRYGDLLISWTSGAATGTWYQVYVNGQLLAATKRLSCSIPAPSELSRIDIGTVAKGEAQTDFSASLPAAPQRRVTLAWVGGTYLDTSGNRDVAGYQVFAAATPAGFGSGGFGSGGFGTGYPTIPTRPTKVIPAYTGGVITDGFGMGGFGAGGFGSASASYSWISDTLSAGLWGFSVAAYDRSGNTGSLTTVYQTIAAPPLAPGASQSGSRLSYSLRGFGVGGFGGQGFGADGFGAGNFGGGVGFGQSQALLIWNA